ncbi:MAG: DNA adenine methylase, partial [Bacteroidetes bacterium]|nr:DNA adenine methylase [Bacteroidota bacterium]
MLPWYGGKGKPELSKWLFENFNLENVNNYVEPFSGMYGIYLSPHTDFSGIENLIYNDIDPQNGNVFHCAQMPIVFLEKINYAFKEGGMFYCPLCKEYNDYFKHYKSIYYQFHKGGRTIPEVSIKERNFEAAFIYSFLRIAAMNQIHYLEAGTRKDIQDGNWYKRYRFFQPLVNKLTDEKFIDKIMRINEITADDFELVMNRYNTSDSFIYCDPPYFSNEDNYDGEKKGDFKIDKDHKRLAKVVNESKARVAVSYYEFDGIYELYPKPKFKYEKKEVYN